MGEKVIYSIPSLYDEVMKNNALLLEENRELRQLIFYLVKFSLNGSVDVGYTDLMTPFIGELHRDDLVDGYRLSYTEKSSR